MRTTEQHDPTVECQGHCYWHHVDEPGPGYRWCGECGHLFRTGDELIQTYWNNAPPGFRREPFDVEEIEFCPHCTHDF